MVAFSAQTIRCEYCSPRYACSNAEKSARLHLGPSFSAGTGAVFVLSLFSFRFLGVNCWNDRVGDYRLDVLLQVTVLPQSSQVLQ
jgi:hypothetical protein